MRERFEREITQRERKREKERGRKERNREEAGGNEKLPFPPSGQVLEKERKSGSEETKRKKFFEKRIKRT